MLRRSSRVQYSLSSMSAFLCGVAASRSRNSPSCGMRVPAKSAPNHDPASSACTWASVRSAIAPVPSVVRSTVGSCSSTGIPVGGQLHVGLDELHPGGEGGLERRAACSRGRRRGRRGDRRRRRARPASAACRSCTARRPARHPGPARAPARSRRSAARTAQRSARDSARRDAALVGCVVAIDRLSGSSTTLRRGVDGARSVAGVPTVADPLPFRYLDISRGDGAASSGAQCL